MYIKYYNRIYLCVVFFDNIRVIGICVTATKYECVRRVGRKLGFKEVEENEDWTLYWTDTSVSIDRVNQMKRWQVRFLNL